jgi:hypothetical protein
MKAEMKIETTVELKMTLAEAQWLQGAMQNPPETCSEENEKMYKYFFLTLQSATETSEWERTRTAKCEGGRLWART